MASLSGIATLSAILMLIGSCGSLTTDGNGDCCDSGNRQSAGASLNGRLLSLSSESILASIDGLVSVENYGPDCNASCECMPTDLPQCPDGEAPPP